MLAIALFPYLSLMPIDSLNAEEQAGTVLPTMTVFGIKRSDSTFMQTSEVEWHDGSDPTIIREKDGSYTARSTTNSYSLKTLLASLGKPTVNIDVRYAANSVSLTAEGDSILETLLESFDYLDEGVTLQLTPTLKASESANRRIMQRRLEVLKEMLARNSRLNFKLMPAKVLSKVALESRRSDTWRIQVRRES